MGIARLLILEIMKGRQREQVAINELTITSSEVSNDSADDSEQRIVCLRQCLEGLTTENRLLITEYY